MTTTSTADWCEECKKHYTIEEAALTDGKYRCPTHLTPLSFENGKNPVQEKKKAPKPPADDARKSMIAEKVLEFAKTLDADASVVTVGLGRAYNRIRQEKSK